MRLNNAHKAKGIRHTSYNKPRVTRCLAETEHRASDLALRSLAETFLLHSQAFTGSASCLASAST